MNVFNLSLLLAKGNKDLFDIPKEEQNRFLRSLEEPLDDEGRSYNQYLCQCRYMPKWKIWLNNFISVIILPFVCVVLLLKRIRVSFDRDIKFIGSFDGIEEVIPEVLTNNYAINNSVYNSGYSLSFKDLSHIIKNYSNFFFAPFFLLKCILKVASISSIISRYKPEIIFVHNEYSFTSSAITHFCNCRGVKHINIMHGEKLFDITDSFFRFDRCYVWDDHYVKLFISLRAYPKQFTITVPPSLKIITAKYIDPNYYADYKYYLAVFDENEIKGIINSMKFAEMKGATVKYRPHPRYSNIELLKKYVPLEKIEDPRGVPILYSISNLQIAVGSMSTVLTQAYFSGKKVILDNLTFKEQFEKSKNLDYILANKNLATLSMCQKDN